MAELKELAELVGGELVGDGSIAIDRVEPIDVAGEGAIAFVSNPKYLGKLLETKASAVILPPGVDSGDRPCIVCKNPYLAFAKVLTFLQVARPEAQGILSGAIVDPSAKIGKDVTIHPGCIIGENVSIGDGSILYPGVILYENVSVGSDCTIHASVVVREGCRLGDRVIIQPSSVIGSDGFGYAPDGTKYYKIPQVGIVVLEDDVEIGSSTCIDRAALGVTLIKRGTKVDNLVQIAHNVKVGEDTILVSHVGISGSTEIGNHCTLGGQSATVGHIKIGDNVMIGARGGVTKDLAPNQILSGAPVMPHKEWLRATKSFEKLPEMRKELDRLKNRIEELENMVQEK